jgi:hypothetical protein
MDDSNKQHWETVFSTKAEDEVNWFQTYPKTSMEVVELFNLPLNAKIIDIGGGRLNRRGRAYHLPIGIC